MTKPSDILPAIAGAADGFINAKNTLLYCHGLWGSDLLRGLLWSVVVEGKVTGAPSWTWAATTSSVRFLDGPDRGQLSRARTPRLRFVKFLLDGTTLFLRGRIRSIELGAVTSDAEQRPSHASFADAKARNVVVMDLETGEVLGSATLDSKRSADKAVFKACVALEISEFCNDSWMTNFLVLLPNENSKDVFRRIGIGNTGRDMTKDMFRFDNSESIGCYLV